MFAACLSLWALLAAVGTALAGLSVVMNNLAE
jgi:hypothetical protein